MSGLTSAVYETSKRSQACQRISGPPQAIPGHAPLWIAYHPAGALQLAALFLWLALLDVFCAFAAQRQRRIRLRSCWSLASDVRRRRAVPVIQQIAARKNNRNRAQHSVAGR